MPFSQGQHDCSSGAKSAARALKVSCCFFCASWRTRGDASLKSVHIFMGLFILFQLFSFVSRCCSLLLFLFVFVAGACPLVLAPEGACLCVRPRLLPRSHLS